MAEIQPGVVDALGFDKTEPEIAEMIVIGRGDGELQVRHSC
jgi:hypothetical protein